MINIGNNESGGDYNARVTIIAKEDTSAITLADTGGRERVHLAVTGNDTNLRLLDESGKVRTTLGAELITTRTGVEERRPESSLVLFGPDGKVAWSAP